MPHLIEREAASLRTALLDWYDQHQRRLPWRAASGEPKNAYRVLVSEIMLQQTTVATVKRRYPEFLQRFPSVTTMASADIDEVLHAWQGLGYYRRARALHAASRAILAKHAGMVPDSVQTLGDLPGIGAYTAAAVAAIAFDRPVVPIDANVTRVIARMIGLEEPVDRGKRVIAATAQQLADQHRAGDFAQAMMDLGALVCKPARPDCASCPWSSRCTATAAGMTDLIPLMKLKKPRPTRYGTAFVARRADGAILFRRRPDQGLLAGMIEVPSSDWRDNPPTLQAERLAKAPVAGSFELQPGEIVHIFTHFRLVLRVALGTVIGASDCIWQQPERLDELALPTLTKRILRHAGLMD